MSQTPLWVPLVVAGLGLLGTVCGTIAGVLIAQRRSDRREQAAWERGRDSEHERWAREDALRTFEHRRAVYEHFYESLRVMALVVYDHGLGLSEQPEVGELAEGWQTPAFRQLQNLALYATAGVDRAAVDAYNAAWRWGHETKHGEDDDAFYKRQAVYDEAGVALLAAIRQDLGIESGNPR